jgi:hypothetical protein
MPFSQYFWRLPGYEPQVLSLRLCCGFAALANPGFRMSRVNCKPQVGDWCMIDLPGVFLEEDIIGTTGLAANTWRTVNLPLGVLGN